MNCMSFEGGKPKDIYILSGKFVPRARTAGKKLPTVCCDVLTRANDA
jgi:hypothetical protein